MSDGTAANNKAFLSSLGLARKAGSLTLGWDRISEEKGTISLIIIASDASERTRKNAKQKTSETLEIPYTMAQLGSAVGIKNAALIAVKDKGFAAMLTKKAAE